VSERIYEVRLLKGRAETRIDPFLANIDLKEAALTGDRMRRYLLAAVARAGGERGDAHLFHLEIREIDQAGKGTGSVRFRWALPMEDVR
jgi:hypothetical protein